MVQASQNRRIIKSCSRFNSFSKYRNTAERQLPSESRQGSSVTDLVLFAFRPREDRRRNQALQGENPRRNGKQYPGKVCKTVNRSVRLASEIRQSRVLRTMFSERRT